MATPSWAQKAGNRKDNHGVIERLFARVPPLKVGAALDRTARFEDPEGLQVTLNQAKPTE